MTHNCTGLLNTQCQKEHRMSKRKCHNEYCDWIYGQQSIPSWNMHKHYDCNVHEECKTT